MPDVMTHNTYLTLELKKTTDQLHELEEKLRAGEVDPRVLTDFREAINHVRHTAWAVQRWVDEDKGGGDPFAVITMVTAERVRITKKLINELLIDFESTDMSLDTPGILELHKAVHDLHDRLKMFVHPKK